MALTPQRSFASLTAAELLVYDAVSVGGDPVQRPEGAPTGYASQIQVGMEALSAPPDPRGPTGTLIQGTEESE